MEKDTFIEFQGQDLAQLPANIHVGNPAIHGNPVLQMNDELALDQLGPMRPAMALSRYATSISGLFCGSAGIHPGGGVSGRPGLLSARAAH